MQWVPVHSRGIKWPGVAFALLPSNSEVKERIQLCLLPLCAFIACYRLNFLYVHLSFRRYVILFMVDIGEISLVLYDGYVVTLLLPIGRVLCVPQRQAERCGQYVIMPCRE